VYLCVICRFLVELDDAIVPTAAGCCICYRCFARETDTTVAMSSHLRGELDGLLAGSGAT
jgi:hypothetical protein